MGWLIWSASSRLHCAPYIPLWAGRFCRDTPGRCPPSNRTSWILGVKEAEASPAKTRCRPSLRIVGVHRSQEPGLPVRRNPIQRGNRAAHPIWQWYPYLFSSLFHRCRMACHPHPTRVHHPEDLPPVYLRAGPGSSPAPRCAARSSTPSGPSSKPWERCSSPYSPGLSESARRRRPARNGCRREAPVGCRALRRAGDLEVVRHGPSRARLL